MGRRDNFDWTDEALARLAALWAEGLSSIEIGRRMGISKNSVIGKAHRLLLAPRPSPIRGEPSARKTVTRRVTGPTLPSMAAKAVVVVTVVVEQARAVAPTPPPVPTPPPAPAPSQPERRYTGQCCWPINKPHSHRYTSCDAPCPSQKPYCDTHAAIAYARPIARRQGAPA